MSFKYNEFGEVMSVNGLTTGQHLGSPMQDALGTQQENSAYSEELSVVTRAENSVDNEQPKNSKEDKPTDSKYFDIDYDGIISLKPAYRGCPKSTDSDYPFGVSDNGKDNNGSLHHELPKKIVIPEVVDDTVVTGFQEGMFYYNNRVEEIVFPDTVTAIPRAFCREAHFLKSIKNTEHITSVGNAAFAFSRIREALFPNLKVFGHSVFNSCCLLYVADIGNEITEIPQQSFFSCQKLSLVKGGAKVTKIATRAFYWTTNLKNLSFLSQVTSLGKYAFYRSRIQFDWSKLPSGAFGAVTDYATPVIDNDIDYWSDCTFTPCEHPLYTRLNQANPLWADKAFGYDEKIEELDNKPNTYADAGCMAMAIMHTHSAFSGKVYTTPKQFEEEVRNLTNENGENIGEELLQKHPTYPAQTIKYLEALGYEVEHINETITTAIFQKVLNALKDGAYLIANVGSRIKSNGTVTVDGGHAVVVYGVNSNKEVLILDSSPSSEAVELYEAFTYRLPFQNYTGPKSQIFIVRKQ